MSFRDLVQLIWSNLNRMRGRVALTAFGVLIGTAAVLLLVSLGAGLQRAATASLGNIGDLKQITVFAPQNTAEVMGPAEPGKQPARRSSGVATRRRASPPPAWRNCAASLACRQSCPWRN